MSNSTKLIIEGMSCQHCVNAVKEMIEEVEGVSSAAVSLDERSADIQFSDDDRTDAIIQNINESNIYKAERK